MNARLAMYICATNSHCVKTSTNQTSNWFSIAILYSYTAEKLEIEETLWTVDQVALEKTPVLQNIQFQAGDENVGTIKTVLQ